MNPIVFDHQAFVIQKYGGISRMYTEIMQHLYDAGVNFELILNGSENAYIQKRPFFKPKYSSEDLKATLPPVDRWLFRGSFPGKGKMYRLMHSTGINQLRAMQNANKSRILSRLSGCSNIIFHPTYYDDYFVEHLGKNHFVLTVYDMIHEIFINQYSRNDMVLMNKKKLVERADCIIAISQSTKNDLVRFWGTSSEKIRVVPIAASLPAKDADDLLVDSSGYLLYVGDRWTYKNFERFVRASSVILKKYDLYLVCAGSQSFSRAEVNLLKHCGVQDRVSHISIQSDRHLSELYTKALFFVFPSLYEGFGIPILEAFSCSCPLVCSNTSSFPEVAGDAALFFDPYSIDSMISAMEKMLVSQHFREELILKGKRQVLNFGWEKTASAYFEVYQSLS